MRKDRALDGSEGPPDESGLWYWFDGSDAAATDPDAVWTDETNTDDSDISTVAFTTTSGAADSEIVIEGTDAPASGGTISSVDAFLYLGPGNTSTQATLQLHTDGQSEQILNTSLSEVPGSWVGPLAVSTPTGGWTWAKLQALEATFRQSSGTDRLEVAAVGVLVHTTTEGESVTDPFRAVNDAADTVAAGDTVYIGAGVYRELFAIDTNGTSGSPIVWHGDVRGEYTGDAGLVIITAYDDERETASRAACIIETVNDVKYQTFRNLTLIGGTTAAVMFNDTTSANSYEGLIFDTCAIIGAHDENDFGIFLDYNTVTAPIGNGLRIRNCLFDGCGIEFQYDEDTSEKDWDILIENSVFNASASTSAACAGVSFDRVTASTNPPGGALIQNCTFNGMYSAIRSQDSITAAPSNTWDVRNCLFRACNTGIQASVTSPFTSDFNIFSRDSSLISVTAGPYDRQEVDDPGLLGGLGDWTLWQEWGWSPFRPFEPIALNDGSYVHAAIGGADATYAPATDAFGSARPMRQDGWRYSLYHFDASDAGPTDNEGTWTGDANAFDGDEATTATTTTSGTETTDELRGEGTNAPATGGTIEEVDYRFYTGTVGTQNVRIYTDGEGESLANTTTTADDTWDAWAALTVPSGGWTWAKLQALEVVLWAGVQPGEVGAVQIRVKESGVVGDDVGAVEARARLEQETTTVKSGTNAARIEGSGFHDFLVPVTAASTTVTIDARFDSNYTVGTKPKLELMNAPGVTSLTSDTMTSAANTWETLSITFTPTRDGVARVRVTTDDSSTDGEAYFDDLTVS